MNAYGTKVSKSRLGSPRFAGSDGPVNSEVKTMKLTSKQLDHYLKTGELPHETKAKEIAEKVIKKVTEKFSGGKGVEEKKKRGQKMKPEQAQELEKSAELLSLEEEYQILEEQLTEACKNNVKLQNLLDDLQAKYNQLAIDYETAEQVKYDLTRTEGQRDQLRASLKETEEVLTEEVKKREALERLVRLYV